MMEEFEQTIEEDKKEALVKGKLSTAFKKLKTRDVAPMLYLKEIICGVGGSKSERYVTDPIQVDRVAREACNPIYLCRLLCFYYSRYAAAQV